MANKAKVMVGWTPSDVGSPAACTEPSPPAARGAGSDGKGRADACPAGPCRRLSPLCRGPAWSLIPRPGPVALPCPASSHKERSNSCLRTVVEAGCLLSTKPLPGSLHQE